MRKNLILVSILLVTALVLAACGGQASSGGNDAQTVNTMTNNNTTADKPAADNTIDMVTPAVEVTDQEISNDTVVVPSVTMAENGWVVIHTTTAEGTPGSVIGYAPVAKGSSTDVKVSIQADQATPQLFAMLHVDAGTAGTYEFPGDDVPVKEGDAIVMKPFNVEGLPMESQGNDSTAMDKTVEIDIANFSFNPSNLEIQVGTTVIWTNSDSAAHTATADDGTFDSGRLGNGDSFSYTFDEAGTFPYHCTFHASMTATITVTP